MSLFPNAELERSAHRLADLPPDTGAEIAFAGRSNSGKSSAINALLGRRRLASVSKLPGRTRAINFFRLERQRYLVDLPGYGYATTTEAQRRQWGVLISAYLTSRTALRGLIVTCDARRMLTPLDGQLIAWFAPARKPIHVLLSKADKLSRSEGERALSRTRSTLERDHPGVTAQLFSSATRTGVAGARRLIESWLK